MTGTLLAVAIVFAVLFISTRAVGYYRGSFSVVDAERRQAAGARQSAMVGAAAGVVVLALVGLLYVGVSQWEWFGRPQPKDAPVVVQKVEPSPVVGGVGSSPAPGAAASPSSVPTPSPQR